MPTATGATPRCGAKFFDIDPGDRPPPPLLRHRPPRGRAPGGPGGVRGDAPARAVAGPRGAVDGLRIDHPDGLADPGGLPRAPARRRRGARVGREDPRPRRAAARLARRGHGRLRVPQRRGGAVRRPRGRGAADRAVGRGVGRPAAVRRGRGRGQARAGLEHVHPGGRAPAPPPRPARPRRGAGLAARLPDLHPRRRGRARGRGGPPRGGHRVAARARRRSSSPASSRRRRR